ncbi:glycosyltransferase family 39 protein [Phreatobacter aquaticus]|uniref:Glycosyltransferase family 39 protein n=1 Tax=Phreatobacter aquaticus TaxID=2570229 RepID=A0A4D7QLA0_9HYPH|nr:glycosyltransferase family 39 protein [Phreatobacter aquaticus]QCK86783.1 glycosyltransferase family 39 protein [Phreatobacter aquaticus]
MTPFDRLSPDPARAALILIAGFTALRIAFAALLGFGVDESYTLGQARFLALSYFDHPPLHIWLAHASMWLFGTTWAVRLPFILLFAGTSWMMFRLTSRLFGPQAGLWATFSLNVSVFFLAAPGTWIVPDGTLLFSLAAGMLALARLFFPTAGETPSPWTAWSVAGLCFGLAGLSKYSAVFVIAGLAIFLLATPHRRWLIHPAPYLGALLAALVVSPVIFWNIGNGWASLKFQAARGGGVGFTPSSFLQMVAGQFVWLAPWVAVPLTYAGVAAMGRWSEPRRLFCLALALPSILYFTLQSLWSGWALPHWPMPGWFFVFPLLGLWLAENPDAKPSPAAWARWSGALAVALALGLGIIGATGLATRLGLPVRADPTIDALNWTELRPRLQALGVGRPGGPIVAALTWNEGGKVDLVVGDIAPVIVLGPDPRGFAFRQDQRAYSGRDAIVVALASTFQRLGGGLDGQFEVLGEAENATVDRMGRPELSLVLVRARGLKSLTPTSLALR